MDPGKFYQRFLYRDLVGYFIPGVFLIAGLAPLFSKLAGGIILPDFGLSGIVLVFLILALGFGAGFLLLGPSILLDTKTLKRSAGKKAIQDLDEGERQQLAQLISIDWKEEESILENRVLSEPHRIINHARNVVKYFKHYDMEMARLKAFEVFSRTLFVVGFIILFVYSVCAVFTNLFTEVEWLSMNIISVSILGLSVWTNLKSKKSYYEAIIQGYFRHKISVSNTE